ncbi:isoleucyl-tRNA synthetase [Pedobacter nyackensis]|uniref:isoleucyl-tRNA synthetase n=1 Tax=Pedobacter nyackensis TaxID=475255 RepID=UPI00292CE945|nr:isoleucyl-tRNA synthetase [Pedobacter nyackensis]
MIKVLRLQKAVYLIILGVVGLIAFKIMEANKIDSGIYVLKLSGLLFLAGAVWFVYPILFAKKVNDTEVQLDPEKHKEAVKSATTNQP